MREKKRMRKESTRRYEEHARERATFTNHKPSTVGWPNRLYRRHFNWVHAASLQTSPTWLEAHERWPAPEIASFSSPGHPCVRPFAAIKNRFGRKGLSRPSFMAYVPLLPTYLLARTSTGVFLPNELAHRIIVAVELQLNIYS